MLSKELREQIEKATVRVTKAAGQGVLVKGNLIVTAAHCIDEAFRWNDSVHGGGFYFIEEIETHTERLKVSPWAVEIYSDIAVLGALDEELEEAEGLKLFCENTLPVSLCLKSFELFQPFPVYVYTHKKEWISGSAQQTFRNASHLVVSTERPIEKGTSGGPIVNEFGELVGIVSAAPHVEDPSPRDWAPAPRPHLTIPVWIANMLREFEPEKD